MPAHSRKSSRRHHFRSMHKSEKKPTLKHHKWRIVSHRHSSKGKPRSIRNIRRVINPLLPYNMNVEHGSPQSPSMVNASRPRERLSRAAKSAHQERRAANAAQRAANAAQRSERRAARAAEAAHTSNMNNIMARMSRMGL